MSKIKKDKVMDQKKKESSEEMQTAPRLEPKEKMEIPASAKKIPEAATNISEPKKEPKEEARKTPDYTGYTPVRMFTDEELGRLQFNRLADLGYHYSEVQFAQLEVLHEMCKCWWDLLGRYYLSINPFK